MKPSARIQTAGRHILVYGPPKVGKTIEVAKLAEQGFKLWWFDGEDGFKSVFAVDADGKPLIDPQAIEDNVELFPIMDNQQTPMMAETMLKVIRTGIGEQLICHEHGKVGCPKCKAAGKGFTAINLDTLTNKDIVVIDSNTQLSQSLMNQVARGTAATAEEYKPDRDDYMKQGFLGDRIYSRIQTAPFNVIVITHENIVEMLDGKKKILPVAGTGNYSKGFARFFDDIVYMAKVNNKHKMFSSSTYADNIVTGSRTGKLVEKSEGAGLRVLFE